MKIYTLGTSHGNSTLSRFNSSTAYQAEDGTLYLVDAGAPCEALLRRQGLNVKDVRAVFITHMHDDHAGGLSGLLKQVDKYRTLREMPFTLFLPEATAIAPLKGWMAALHESTDPVEFLAVDDGQIYDDENLTVTAIRTAHLRTKGRSEGDPCSFAFLLHSKADGKTVLHTGDLRRDFSDFPRIAAQEHFDLCLCEATHYDPLIAQPTLEQAKFDRLLFIHIGDRWHDQPDAPLGSGEQSLLDLCATLPYPVAVAHDGDEFSL